ncbi:MAG: endonuclease/exonuclease/phosphatase family protein, partial [Mycoplasmataceae bacterium]|nr:endonuclease/exonuclease/phosphatase family protein [Mycoplasmataceae bacterium]
MKLALKITGGVIGVGVVAGFATTMVIVNKHDEETVGKPNTKNIIPSGWVTKKQLAEDDIKIGNWNIANFHGTNYNKNHAIAQVILDAEVSLIGIEEVDYTSGLFKVAKELNKIKRLHDVWKVVTSKLSYKATGDANVTAMGGLSAREYYGFIYDSTKLTPKADVDGNIGRIYDNPFKENKYLVDGETHDHTITNTKSAYVRPPFGATFEYNKNKKDFTAVIAHLDSPGYGKAKSNKALVKNHSSKTGPTFEFHSSSSSLLATNYDTAIGSQEAWEAENLPDVMKFFNDKNGTDEDMIFLGDTNIKNHKSHSKRPFQSTLNGGYKESFDPSLETSKTSLGKSDNYASPYDRIFSKTDLINPDDGERYDFTRVFRSALVDPKKVKAYAPITLNDSHKLSDHTMVTQILHMKNQENGRSASIASNQGAKDIDVNNMTYFEMTSTMGMSPKEAYKIIYYRAFVGAIDTEEKLDNLVKYFSKRKGKYSGSASYA